MLLQDTDQKKLKKVDSTAWQNYAVEKLVVLENVVQDVVQHKDRLGLPNQLLEVANDALKSSSDISSLKNHKKDFEQLIGKILTLFIILWLLYIESKAIYPPLSWPSPKLTNLVDELVGTTRLTHKLIGRKSEKNVAKRVLLGCFGIRDLGKPNKYERRLSNMAFDLQSKPHNIDIHAALLTVVHSRAQRQHEDSHSEHAGDIVESDLPDIRSAKKRTTDKKPTAEGSGLCEVEGTTSVKLANQKVESEEDSQRKSSKAKNETNDNPKHERDEERSAEDKPAGRKIYRRTRGNEEARENQLVESTFAQGSRSNNTAHSKTRGRPSEAYKDDENARNTASKRESRSRKNLVTPQTSGLPLRHQVNISSTEGSGNMINENIGNVYITPSE